MGINAANQDRSKHLASENTAVLIHLAFFLSFHMF